MLLSARSYLDSETPALTLCDAASAPSSDATNPTLAIVRNSYMQYFLGTIWDAICLSPAHVVYPFHSLLLFHVDSIGFIYCAHRLCGRFFSIRFRKPNLFQLEAFFLFISWPSFYVLGARVGLTLVGRATQDGPRCNLASFSSSVYNCPILWKHRGAIDLLVSHMFLFPFAPPYSYVIFHSVGASARRFLCRRQLFSDQISISSGFQILWELAYQSLFRARFSGLRFIFSVDLLVHRISRYRRRRMYAVMHNSWR